VDFFVDVVVDLVDFTGVLRTEAGTDAFTRADERSSAS
jgi:hypothetical protein